MIFNTTSVSKRWMIAALLLSPISSTLGLNEQTAEARDPKQGGCISGTPFCFPQAFDHVTGISMALIIPSKSGSAVGSSGFLPPDFIASISTPLPYGFAGIGGSDESEKEAANVAASGFMTLAFWIEGIFGRSQSESNYVPIVQIYAQSTTGNTLTRVENPLDAGAKITVSPRSTESSTTSHMLFRCQNCPIQILSVVSSSSIKVATSISPEQPMYPDPARNSSAASGAKSPSESVVLPLADIKQGSVVVTPFQTGEYEAIAKILQLD